jgi:hypothetical protein
VEHAERRAMEDRGVVVAPIRPEQIIVAKLTGVQIKIINEMIQKCYIPSMRSSIIRWTVIAEALGIPYDYFTPLALDIQRIYMDWIVVIHDDLLNPLHHKIEFRMKAN